MEKVEKMHPIIQLRRERLWFVTLLVKESDSSRVNLIYAKETSQVFVLTFVLLNFSVNVKKNLYFLVSSSFIVKKLLGWGTQTYVCFRRKAFKCFSGLKLLISFN